MNMCLQVQKKPLMYPKCLADPTLWKCSPAKNHNSPPAPRNLLTILHLQTQNQSFSKLVMVRQYDREGERQHLLFIRMIEMMNKFP